MKAKRGFRGLGMRWGGGASVLACAVVTFGCTSGLGGAGVSSSGSSTPAANSTSGDLHYDAMSALGYRLEWSSFAVVPRRRQVQFVQAHDDLVAIHETGNSITILDADTGAQRWNAKLADAKTKFVGLTRLGDGDLVDVSQTEVYLLDDKSGVMKDRQRLDVIAETRPVVFGAIVVVASASGEVLGHNIATGYRQWGYQMPGPIHTNPARIGRAVCIVDDNGSLFVLEALSGASAGRSRMYDGISGGLAVEDDLIIAASRDQSLWAFPSTGGEARWRVRTAHELHETPVAYNGTVYIELPGEGLVAFASGTAQRKWAVQDVHGRVVAVRGGNLIVWDGKAASLLDPGTGGIVTQVKLPGVSMLVPDAFADGNLYAIEPRGRVQKFSPK